MDSPVQKRIVERMLGWIERGGNALPHPATLFTCFALLTVVLSRVACQVGIEAIHPGTGEVITPVNLLSITGLHRIILGVVDNYTGFAPLGVVMVAMLGIGIAESSGLINAVIRLLVIKAPGNMLTFIVVFAGVLSNLAGNVGYVLLIPLAGIIFQAVGRHPIAGIAAAFAGVSGGFSANLFVGAIDPVLAGLSTEAARIVDPEYTVNPTANYYFLVASTFMISLVGSWVTRVLIEPRLGSYTGTSAAETIVQPSAAERRGLYFSLLTGLLLCGGILWGILPAAGFLRDVDGGVLTSPLIRGVVTILLVLAGLMGLAYGFGAGTFKSEGDVIKGMTKAMVALAPYLVIVFFAAQFVAYFKWTNLGIILAIKGASILEGSGLGVIPLMLIFIIFSALANLLMGSASAKWALMAPVFIPMFMFLGISPELTQAVYRIGDSVSNIVSPMLAFFALIIAFVQKYEPRAGIGTIMATMLPYSLAFFLAWALLLVIWIVGGFSLGPGSGLYYAM